MFSSQPLLGLFSGKATKKKPQKPRYGDRDPRALKAMEVQPSKVRYLLPFSLACVLSGIAYVVYESQKRREEGAVCVDCDRQRQIAEEVYFKKSPPKQAVGGSQLGTRVA